MARIPERGIGLPSGLPGVGVVERGETSETARLGFDLLLPSFQDIIRENVISREERKPALRSDRF